MLPPLYASKSPPLTARSRFRALLRSWRILCEPRVPFLSGLGRVNAEESMRRDFWIETGKLHLPGFLFCAVRWTTKELDETDDVLD
jgi:hypothetical protein